MFSQFLKYFIRFIFFGKNKQKLLFLALMGLVLSSFALFVLQSTMGGLQKNLIARAKNVQGSLVIQLISDSYTERESILSLVDKLKSDLGHEEIYPEYEMELLLKSKGFISPVLIHGINWSHKRPKFLEDKEVGLKEGTDTLLGVELLQKMKTDLREEMQLISPSHTTMFMGDIPRTVTATLGGMIISDVAEVDQFEAWTSEDLLDNIIRGSEYNLIRFFNFNLNKEKLKKIQTLLNDFSIPESAYQIKTWEDQNESLVWALNMESTVMVALFVIMTLLVGISITSGLMIFFGKIQSDLVSFWILGCSKMKIEKMAMKFVHLLCAGAVLLGLILGGIFLFFLRRYSSYLMPDVFLEKNMPVYITFQGVFLSLFIPYFIAALFSYFSFFQFKKDERTFIEQLRS